MKCFTLTIALIFISFCSFSQIRIEIANFDVLNGFQSRNLYIDPNKICDTATTLECKPNSNLEYAKFGPNGNLFYFQETGQAPKIYTSADECTQIEYISQAPIPKPLVSSTFGAGWPFFLNHLGNIYLTLNLEGDRSSSFLVKESPYSNVPWKRVSVNLPVDFRIADVQYLKDRIYFIGADLPRKVYEFDLNYNLIDKYELSYQIEHFAVHVKNCDSIRVFAFGLYPEEYSKNVKIVDPNTNVEVEKTTDSLIIFEYFPTTRKLEKLCIIKMPLKVANLNSISSKTEFLATETECDLLIDLDRNNSGRLYPYDFAPKENLCFGNTASITDTDAYIHATYPIDTIFIEIKGVKDVGKEYITLAKIFPDISFKKINESKYILVGKAKTPDSLYAAAIKSLVYHNDASIKTYGVRTVVFQGVNNFKQSLKVNSHITIGVTVERDTLICSQTTINYNGKYYMVGDTIQKWKRVKNGCDTLFLSNVKSIPLPETVYTGDTSLCEGAKSLLTYTGKEAKFKWILNKKEVYFKSIEVGDGDSILLEAENTEGCISQKPIKLQTIPNLIIEKRDTIEIEKGSAVIDTFLFFGDEISNVYSEEKSIKFLPPNKLSYTTLSSGEYMLKFVGKRGCEVNSSTFIKINENTRYNGIPNVMKLQGSEKNRVWEPKFPPNIEVHNCAIYDRWGNLVYSYQGENPTWDGKSNTNEVVEGVYVYFIMSKDILTNKPIVYSGDVLVLK
jgi:gliding motility-associated-like protein